jgi:WD40 repeat protein
VTPDARIFVSYARSDGGAAARALRSRLHDEHGFALWQDLADLEGGKDWWRQITEAIEHVEYVVLVMTPGALRSTVVRQEWRHARQAGRCVLPVMGAAGLDFSGLPGWMRRTHFVDASVPEQWMRFVRTLESPCRATRVPMMADPPPHDYVPRRREIDALRSRLLDTRQEPVAITAALRGAGGYGKTTLARALCHDDAIVDAFHDGVLWVTLGEQPGDLAGKVEDLIVALTGTPSGLSSLETRKARLRELLADRSVLLVVDDVWSRVHLEPFLVTGPHSAHLITTRNADTLPADVREVRVDAMQSREALALLGWGLPAGEAPALATLAGRLGEWPLLLKLVNGVLRDRVDRSGDSLRHAVEYAARVLDRRGLTGFDPRDAEQRHQAVATTLGVSIERLRNDERDRLHELAVFPEDVEVPIGTAEMLWAHTAGLDDLATEELLQRFSSLSLLVGIDLARRTFRLHDVVRTYLRGELGPERLAALDLAVVTGYRTLCPDGWAAGIDDGYFFHHLPGHLARAHLDDELRGLLLDVGWLEAKLAHAGVSAVLEDYARHAADPTASTLGRALRLSAHVLARDPDALLSQLFGRIDIATEPELGALLDARAGRRHASPWLRPCVASLRPPGGALLQTFVGHADRVTSVAVTPSGTRVVSGSDDRTLRVWDLASGLELAMLTGHRDMVLAVAVTPDGTRLVSGSVDETVKIWDLASARELATLSGHRASVRAVAVTPDGRRVVSASDDCTVKVWDLASGRELRTLEGHHRWVPTVAVTPDGTRLISGSGDATVRVWDLDSGRGLATLTGHDDGVWSVAVTPDGRHAISGGFDRTLKVWDLAAGSEVMTVRGHRSRVWSLAVTPDGTRAVFSCARTLKVCGLSDGGELAALEGHQERVRGAAVTPDGRFVVSGSDDRTIRVWDLASSRRETSVTEHRGEISALAVTPDRTRLISGSWDRTIKAWDATDLHPLGGLAQTEDVVSSLAVTADGTRVVTGGWDKALVVWELATGRCLTRLEGHTAEVACVALTPDGTRAVSGSWDKTLRLWDLQSGQQLATLGRHQAEISALAVSPDGSCIVSGSEDSVLRILTLEGGHAIPIVGHGAGIADVAVTPEGRRVVSASWDKTLRVWDGATGRELLTLRGHDGRVTSVAVTPDGAHAISGSDDSTAKVWDLAAGRLLATFHSDSPIRAVACGGPTLFFAGSADGVIHALELRPA